MAQLELGIEGISNGSEPGAGKLTSPSDPPVSTSGSSIVASVGAAGEPPAEVPPLGLDLPPPPVEGEPCDGEEEGRGGEAEVSGDGAGAAVSELPSWTPEGAIAGAAAVGAGAVAELAAGIVGSAPGSSAASAEEAASIAAKTPSRKIFLT